MEPNCVIATAGIASEKWRKVLAGRLSLAASSDHFACIGSSVFLKKNVNFGIRRLTKYDIALNKPFNKWAQL